MAPPPDDVELDMLDAEEFGTHAPAPRVRAWWWWWIRLRLPGPHGRIGVVSTVLFLGLSWYFSMPSTLYLYIVAVCFTCPMLLWVMLYHREWRTTSLVRRTLVVVVTAWVALSVLRGWAPAHLPVPPAWLASNDTFYIASILHNAECILPQYTDALLSFARDVGPDRVYVSILENDSLDRTPDMLQALRGTLQRMGVPHTIASAPLPASIRSLERIERLSTLRNRAMRPLYDDVLMPISKVVWINDVLFTPNMLHHLVHTLNGTYDQACALDYFWLGFYDTWVLRDQYGKTVRPLWPYFRHKRERRAVDAETPIPVNSCWNGLTVFDARWFTNQTPPVLSRQPAVASLPPPPIERQDGLDYPAKLPLQFRTCASCNVSEATLTSVDMHRLTRPHRPRIFVNPAVKVAYDYPSYYMYNHLLYWYVTQPWRYLWETWIERRLFSWIANLGNRWDPCAPLLQRQWSPEAASWT